MTEPDWQRFHDPERAAVNWRSISEGVPPDKLAFAGRLWYELSQWPDPDELLNRFERLTRSAINRAAFCKMVCDFPPIIARLIRLFASSAFLSELLIRDFQYTYFLIRPENDCRSSSTGELERLTNLIVSAKSGTVNRKLELLKGFRRRELLKIGIRDLILNEPLPEITASISDLADTVIRAVLGIQSETLKERYGIPQTSFCVLALGKLGGSELNYSSDVDVMFLYGEEGTTAQTDRSITHHEFFNHLSGAVIESAGKSTPEGLLYRVDARLRPDGDAGPLARSESAAYHYYESRGQLWERQMLIKARPVAGDLAFGNRFLERLRPFVYPKTFFESPLKAIAQMKWRIEERHASDRLNIKTAPGGIRDIEFIVQAQQLINGGHHPELRNGNTLRSIELLVGKGFLSVSHGEQLRSAYEYLRRIEHILQIEQDSPTHTLRGQALENEKIVRILGLASETNFGKFLADRMQSVRRIYEEYFRTDETATDRTAWLSSETLSEEAGQRLRQEGFEDTVNVHRVLRAMAFGQFPKLYSNTIQGRFLEWLPTLLRELGTTPNPDQTLFHLERMTSRFHTLETLYRSLLLDPGFNRSLLDLCSLSAHVTSVLAENPSLLEYLQSHLEAWRKDTPPPERSSFVDRHTYKALSEIRSILHLFWKKETLPELMSANSGLADTIVREIWNECFAPDMPVSLIALGKFGGQELSFKSDLDVVFVSRDETQLEDLIAMAKRFLSGLTQVTSQGKLYECDARLRPEGSQAPLVTALDRYRTYFKDRAMFWERQTLTKARWICGDPDLGSKIMNFFHSEAYSKEWKSEHFREIVTMRERQIDQKIRNSDDALLELKYARGGLLDIEYLVQGLQMKFLREHATPMNSTLEAITGLQNAGRFNDEDSSTLVSNYNFMRSLEVFVFLAFERRSTKLPTDKKQLAILASFVDINTVTSLIEKIKSTKESNRRLFSKYLGDT